MQNEHKSMTEEEKMQQAIRTEISKIIQALNNEKAIVVDGKNFDLFKHRGSVCDGGIYREYELVRLEEEYKYKYIAEVRFWENTDGMITTISVKLTSFCELYWESKQWHAKIESLTYSKL